MLYTYPNAGTSVCRELRKAEQSIVGTCYCLDYGEGCRSLEAKRRSNVEVRILLDRDQQLKPSAKMQPARIAELLAWGVEVRTYAPDRGDFAALHAKTWLVDGLTLIAGSANFTTNGMERSEELVTVIRDEDAATIYLEWFERLWAAGAQVASS